MPTDKDCKLRRTKPQCEIEQNNEIEQINDIEPLQKKKMCLKKKNNQQTV